MPTQRTGAGACCALPVRARSSLVVRSDRLAERIGFLVGQVPKMLGKCPMSDCNFTHCIPICVMSMEDGCDRVYQLINAGPYYVL